MSKNDKNQEEDSNNSPSTNNNSSNERKDSLSSNNQSLNYSINREDFLSQQIKKMERLLTAVDSQEITELEYIVEFEKLKVREKKIKSNRFSHRACVKNPMNNDSSEEYDEAFAIFNEGHFDEYCPGENNKNTIYNKPQSPESIAIGIAFREALLENLDENEKKNVRECGNIWGTKDYSKPNESNQKNSSYSVKIDSIQKTRQNGEHHKDQTIQNSLKLTNGIKKQDKDVSISETHTNLKISQHADMTEIDIHMNSMKISQNSNKKNSDVNELEINENIVYNNRADLPNNDENISKIPPKKPPKTNMNSNNNSQERSSDKDESLSHVSEERIEEDSDPITYASVIDDSAQLLKNFDKEEKTFSELSESIQETEAALCDLDEIVFRFGDSLEYSQIIQTIISEQIQNVKSQQEELDNILSKFDSFIENAMKKDKEMNKNELAEILIDIEKKSQSNEQNIKMLEETLKNITNEESTNFQTVQKIIELSKKVSKDKNVEIN